MLDPSIFSVLVWWSSLKSFIENNIQKEWVALIKSFEKWGIKLQKYRIYTLFLIPLLHSKCCRSWKLSELQLLCSEMQQDSSPVKSMKRFHLFFKFWTYNRSQQYRFISSTLASIQCEVKWGLTSVSWYTVKEIMQS